MVFPISKVVPWTQVWYQMGGSEQAAHAEHGAVACTRHKSTHIYTTQEL